MSLTQECRRTLLEFLIVGGLMLGAALLANSRNEDGLSLRKNYFGVALNPMVGTEPIPVVGSQPLPGEDDAIAKVSARLREAGLQPIDHDDVVGLFQDENYEFEQYVFVDARNDEHYQEGHIPGAYQFDHFHMERYLDEVMSVAEIAEKVVVYCYGRDCSDSEITATHIVNMGVDRTQVYVYVGGMQSWCEAGQQIETGARGSGNLTECKQ